VRNGLRTSAEGLTRWSYTSSFEQLDLVVHVEHGVRERESASARTWTARR
jgi:hypothetical protein